MGHLSEESGLLTQLMIRRIHVGQIWSLSVFSKSRALSFLEQIEVSSLCLEVSVSQVEIC